MRTLSIALVSAAALMAAAPALAQDAAAAAPAAAPATGEVSDAQLESFNGAMTKVRALSQAAQGGTPTAEQQAEMAAAISGSGLSIEQFNAISTQVSSDAVLRARLAVIAAPAPAAGSVAAEVTDDEVAKFSTAMVKMREIAPTGGAAPTPEQQAEMASTVEASGLSRERFNAIATAVSQDDRLRARVELADAKRG